MQTTIFQTDVMEVGDIEGAVREHLAAFARGDFDAWGESFAPNVFFTAADPEEVFLERETVVAEMHRDFDFAFDEGLQVDLEPQSFRLGISPDQKLAWSAAPLRYTVRFQGEANSFVLRHTAVLLKIDRRWFITATQYSLTLPEARILEVLTGRYLPTPNVIVNKIPPNAQSLVNEFTDNLADLSIAAITRDAYAFGPFPEEYAEGETDVRALFAKWTARWCAPPLGPDEVMAEFVSAESGWVGANVEVNMLYMGEQVTLPLRALFVYQKEQDHWAIDHAHLSVGIPDELAE